jgi:pRiA4b ORF-3-like protein
MAALRKPSDAPIYQLKVTLKETKPPIWRRILVPGDSTLPRLHRILQVVMGWYDSHLHQFKVGGASYGEPDRDFPDDMISERKVKLNQVAPHEKDRFTYEYDFGDSWEHDIVVERILPAVPGADLPACIAGKRACPPEDCGGVWGYESFLEAIGDPDHPEHDEMLQWAGGTFDPEAFDLAAVNAQLRRIR